MFGEAAGAVLVVPRDLLAQDGLVEHCAEAVGLIDGGHVHQRDGDGGQEELARSQYGRNNGCNIYRVTMVVSNWDYLTSILCFLISVQFCLGRCKLGRSDKAVGQDCGSSKIKSTKRIC